MNISLPKELIGVEPKDWFDHLDVSDSEFLKFGIIVVETLMPDWQDRNPNDTTPVRAVEAAKNLLEEPTDNLRSHAKVLAKGCTKSRKASLGYDHRIAEAARAIANAAAQTSPDQRIEAVSEAFQRAEDHLVYMYSVAGVYGKEGEGRAGFISSIEAELRERN